MGEQGPIDQGVIESMANKAEGQDRPFYWRPKSLEGNEGVAMAASTKALTEGDRQRLDTNKIIRQTSDTTRYNTPLSEQTEEQRSLKIAAARNLVRFIKELDPEANPHHLIKTKLEHGTQILVIDQGFLDQLDDKNEDSADFRKAFAQKDADTAADIVMTNIPHVPLMVVAADCAPLGLYDKRTGAVAAVHSGWRGTIGYKDSKGDTISRTLAAMGKYYDTKPEDIVAIIGPYADSEKYQLSGDMRHLFENATSTSGDHLFTNEEIDKFLKPSEQGHFHFDNGVALKILLEKAGVKSEHIESSPMGTMSRNDLFSSERVEGEKDRDVFAFIAVRKK